MASASGGPVASSVSTAVRSGIGIGAKTTRQYVPDYALWRLSGGALGIAGSAFC
jgi:hypothetical protein